MFGYLSNLYQPAIEALLARFGLAVPDSTLNMLTTTLVTARFPATPRLEGSRSPVPAAKSALAHARKVLAYLQDPPARKDSLPKRVASLRAAMRGSDILTLELSQHLRISAAEYACFLESLSRGDPSEDALSGVIEALEKISDPDSNWQSGGRPVSQSTTIIQAACIAWDRAGRTEKYTWNEVSGSLDGALPDFIRGLLCLCNGKDEAIDKIERRRPSLLSKSRAGDGIALNDKAIQAVLLTCKKSGLI